MDWEGYRRQQISKEDFRARKRLRRAPGDQDASDEEMKKIFDDQQRLRENMKALKGSSEEKLLVQRYTQLLNDQETRLEKLGKEIEQLQKEMDAAQGVLHQMIRDLAVDTAV